MGSYIFPYIQNCPEILPDQCKIASSAPDIALNLASCYISYLSLMPHALFSYTTGGNDLTITYIYIYIYIHNIVVILARVVCLVYTSKAQGPRVYISGKPRVPMLTLLCDTNNL